MKNLWCELGEQAPENQPHSQQRLIWLVPPRYELWRFESGPRRYSPEAWVRRARLNRRWRSELSLAMPAWWGQWRAQAEQQAHCWAVCASSLTVPQRWWVSGIEWWVLNRQQVVIAVIYRGRTVWTRLIQRPDQCSASQWLVQLHQHSRDSSDYLTARLNCPRFELIGIRLEPKLKALARVSATAPWKSWKRSWRGAVMDHSRASLPRQVLRPLSRALSLLAVVALLWWGLEFGQSYRLKQQHFKPSAEQSRAWLMAQARLEHLRSPGYWPNAHSAIAAGARVWAQQGPELKLHQLLLTPCGVACWKWRISADQPLSWPLPPTGLIQAMSRHGFVLAPALSHSRESGVLSNETQKRRWQLEWTWRKP